MKFLGQLLALFLVILLSGCSALYDKSDDVKFFDDSKDFKMNVLESDSLWIIQFFAPWCGHCQNFAQTYKQAATLLKGIVNFGVIDAASEGPLQAVAAQYGVKGFPTIKIFGNDKLTPKDYKGARDPNSLVNSALKEVQKMIEERGQNPNAKSDRQYSNSSKSGQSNVVELDANNFKEKVLDNPEVGIVAFVAPWCGHCKALLPEWDAASLKLEGEGVFLGVVDATVEDSLAREYGVSGYPTIKVFPGGLKTASNAINYEGGRQSEQIIKYALEEVDRSGVPKEIPEMIKSDVLYSNCDKPGKICVLVALPHILETNATGRNKYKDVMAGAAKAVRGMPFQFLWFEGSAQPELENSLELTFGFPAVAAISMDKKVYAIHRGSFTVDNVRKFLTGIVTGRQPTYKMQGTLQIQTVEAWDGQDGIPFEEESLEDIMGWDEEDEL